MIKYGFYDGRAIASIEIDGVPYADMEGILSLAIPGSWSDYEQVLNSSSDLQYDLDIQVIDERWVIPVVNISAWLFSFSIRAMDDEMRDRFRIFRRDVEKVLRVVWALPVDNLVPYDYHSPWDDIDTDGSIYSLHNIFHAFGIPEEDLMDIDEEGHVYGPLHYLEHVCGSTQCGPRGHMVCEMIQYIEQLPNGDRIFSHINDLLCRSVPPMTEYLDEYLDELNIFISGITSRFVGEL